MLMVIRYARSDTDSFRNQLSRNCHRAMYARQYPPNSLWRGYLSPMAIGELERMGNTVRREGDHYLLNGTAPAQAPVTTTLVASMREQTTLEVF
jgi:hypothetical protein